MEIKLTQWHNNKNVNLLAPDQRNGELRASQHNKVMLTHVKTHTATHKQGGLAVIKYGVKGNGCEQEK